MLEIKGFIIEIKIFWFSSSLKYDTNNISFDFDMICLYNEYCFIT